MRYQERWIDIGATHEHDRDASRRWRLGGVIVRNSLGYAQSLPVCACLIFQPFGNLIDTQDKVGDDWWCGRDDCLLIRNVNVHRLIRYRGSPDRQACRLGSPALVAGGGLSALSWAILLGLVLPFFLAGFCGPGLVVRGDAFQGKDETREYGILYINRDGRPTLLC